VKRLCLSVTNGAESEIYRELNFALSFPVALDESAVADIEHLGMP
jgi:hypothetical protein